MLFQRAAALVLTFCFASALQAQPAEAPLMRALAHFRSNARAYGLSDPGSELKLRSLRRSGTDLDHVRFRQFFKGIPVFEGEAVAHLAGDGRVSVTNAIRSMLADLDTRPALDEAAAVASAVRSLGIRGPVEKSEAELQILPRGQRSATDQLVWHVELFYENDLDGTGQFDVFISAVTGQPVLAWNSLHTAAATGTGRSMYLGDKSVPVDRLNGQFYLRDLAKASSGTRDMKNRQSGSGSIFTSVDGFFGNNAKDLSDRATAAADAHFGFVASWEYFQNNFGRNGIDGTGRQANSRVHYGRNYENAFWSNSCFCMTYGDGGFTFYPLVSVDVAGHELAHGVMSTEANLTYTGESGGLNESSSDIFGTLIEWNVNDKNDGNAFRDDTPDWWIGERIYRANWAGGNYQQTNALRYMDDPARDGVSPSCWYAGLGNLDVHYSSGPNNHMFWLLAQGGRSKCDGSTVIGIGRDKAGRIWYEAITNWMTPSTNYAGARQAMLRAAETLYGIGSAERAAVAAAYSAIKVN